MQTIIGNITPKGIVKAYKKVGWKPITQYWVRVDKGEMCGCALSVFAKCQTGTIPESQTPQGYADFLGITRDQVVAFTLGYDGFAYDKDDRTWFDLGAATRKAVFSTEQVAN